VTGDVQRATQGPAGPAAGPPRPGRLRDKVAVVTGGGSGMGRAGATLMASEGARVVVADVDLDRALAVTRAITAAGGAALAVEVDVRRVASVERLVATAVADYGRIDVLYHNAVDARFVNERDGRLTELPEDTWHQIVELVLTGTFYCCKYVGQQMLAQRAGSIILTATVDALVGCAGLDAYTAAKGGVVAVTRSFAAGMARDGVRVNAICPGFVATEPQLAWLEAPGAQAAMRALHLLPVARPEQIAPFAVYLASDEAAVVTGGVFPIDSGYMAFKADVDVMAAVRATAPGAAPG
jgi:NAD(P)-dependent dehydrogenase (short-subunit alcohol dehydrogenase family)